jgi:hypothetical protein
MSNCPLFCSNHRDESENTKINRGRRKSLSCLQREFLVPSGCGLQASALLVNVKEYLS